MLKLKFGWFTNQNGSGLGIMVLTKIRHNILKSCLWEILKFLKLFLYFKFRSKKANVLVATIMVKQKSTIIIYFYTNVVKYVGQQKYIYSLKCLG